MSNSNAMRADGTPVPEITIASASEYDHILLIDRSGSMAEPSMRYQGKSRWQEVEEYAKGFFGFLKDVDDDGLTIITFAGDVKVTDGVTDMQMIIDLFKNEAPKGGTNLHLAIDEAMKKLAQSHKPGFIHIFTDGEPTDPVAVQRAIAHAVATMKKEEDLAFNILQVGDDPAATKFLHTLDDELVSKYKLQFDAVHAMTTQQSDGLTYGQILWLAIND